jgi:nitrous oxidase accessory protein
MLFICLILFGFWNIPLARVIEVCVDCPVTKIKSAIAQASDADQIIIHAGLYKEGNIIVDKSVHILGIDYPILDGEGETEILTIVADSVIIEGLHIRNVGTSYLEDRAGIRIKKSKHFKIINNQLYDTFFGIYLEHSKHGMISGNEIKGEAEQEMSSGNAIHLWYCKNILVENNEVLRHRDGIYFEFVDSSLIRNNLSADNLRYGLHFMFSNDDEYYKNVFRNNGAGVAVMFSKRIFMIDNIFEKNWGRASYGLLLKEIYDAEIRNNTIIENTIGIYVEGSTRIKYTENEIIRNGWAMKISGGCLDNEVWDNNFIGNAFDLSLGSSINNNSFDKNYWSDYNGYDLDKDGHGDIPYYPVKLFNFVVNRTPEAIVLLRSLFVDLINFSEKISPVFTPAKVTDGKPYMKKLQFESNSLK